MKPPFVLTDDTISHSTVEALQDLLNDAKMGKLIGIAFAAMYKKPRRSYVTNTAGELHRNATFAVGMLLVLVAKLLRQIISKSPIND
ncbi:hypothetical protein SAMN05216428_102336 [Nitrosospira sp. Nsp11]|uniref:hypothetical protein n=1 Tax=Nitrosospira sp. Nsp11 TaxID=1855338 RepID=UPI000914434D|nr:hypothetical protein [Nitrosospira sp. Nsp11]SHL41679.1 hypothetical protein SAMN05216428_102336 [Nitrosospira sp. Nsp11]